MSMRDYPSISAPAGTVKTVPVPYIEWEAKRLTELRKALRLVRDYVKADRPEVAEYLDAVNHGVNLGELALYGAKNKRPS